MAPTVLQKYSKALVSLLTFAFAAVALFWGGDIFGFHITADFQEKVTSLIPLLAGVVAVIGVKTSTPDDWNKAIMQLVTGMTSVAVFFHEIPADLGVQIGVFVYAGVAAYFVWLKGNHPSTVGIHEKNLAA